MSTPNNDTPRFVPCHTSMDDNKSRVSLHEQPVMFIDTQAPLSQLVGCALAFHQELEQKIDMLTDLLATIDRERASQCDGLLWQSQRIEQILEVLLARTATKGAQS
jgi:hypothetical protein